MRISASGSQSLLARRDCACLPRPRWGPGPVGRECGIKLIIEPEIEGFHQRERFLKYLEFLSDNKYFYTLCCFDVGFGAVRYMTIAESKARTDPSPRAAVQPNHMAT